MVIWMTDLHALPPLTTNDATNKARGNPEVPGNRPVLHRLCHLFDFGYLIRTKLGVDATPLVLAAGDNFKVFGIHTCSIAAQMIQNQSIGDRADQTFVDESVEKMVLPVDHHAAVPEALVPRPSPASNGVIALNLGKHAFDRFASETASVTLNEPTGRGSLSAAPALAQASRNGILRLHSILQRLSATPRLLQAARGTFMPSQIIPECSLLVAVW